VASKVSPVKHFVSNAINSRRVSFAMLHNSRIASQLGANVLVSSETFHGIL